MTFQSGFPCVDVRKRKLERIDARLRELDEVRAAKLTMDSYKERTTLNAESEALYEEIASLKSERL